MVESPKYERLKALMSLSAEPLGAEDLSEDTRVGDAHSDVGVAKSGSEDFVADLSVGLSQTKEGADGWMSSFIVDAGRHLDTIESTKAHHLTLREQMSKKVVESRNLSPVLIEPELEYLRHSDETVTIADPSVAAKAGAVEVTGRAYIAALEAQRNEEREAEADKILTQLNADAHAEKSSIYKPMDDFVPEAWRPAPASEPAPDPGPQSGGGGYGRRRGMSGGLVPTVGAETVAGSGASGWTYPPAGELGSVSNPISDPADLVRYDLTTTPVNQRMTPNGPVGGHMPADVLNVNDPAWRPVPSSGGGARIAGGVLVAGSAAGAAGAALSYGGGFAGIGGLASGASGSALRAVAPAGGVLRPSALPGGGVAGAVGGAGRGGGAGVVGRGGVAPVGSGAAGSAGGRGASAGGRGASGGVAGRGGVSAAGRGASGAGAVGRGGVAPVGSGASGTAGGRGGVAGGRATSGVTAVGRGASGGVAGRGGVAPVGSGGVGDRREKKGQVRRRAYDVVRVDALEERGAQMMGGAAGSADQLKPIARDADADW